MGVEPSHIVTRSKSPKATTTSHQKGTMNSYKKLRETENMKRDLKAIRSVLRLHTIRLKMNSRAIKSQSGKSKQ